MLLVQRSLVGASIRPRLGGGHAPAPALSTSGASSSSSSVCFSGKAVVGRKGRGGGVVVSVVRDGCACKKRSVVTNVVSTNKVSMESVEEFPDLDVDEFEKRFQPPHVTDVFDVQPGPSTFSTKTRYVVFCKMFFFQPPVEKRFGNVCDGFPRLPCSHHHLVIRLVLFVYAVPVGYLLGEVLLD